MTRFQALLRERLTQRGDLARLAEKSGVAAPVIGRYVTGEMRPRPEKLEKLAPALDVPYEELMRMCGYLPDRTEMRADLNTRLDATARQLAEWSAAVGERYKPLLLDMWKRDHETVADWERRGIAVNAPADAAVNAADKRRRTRVSRPPESPSGPLTHMLHTVREHPPRMTARRT